MAIRINHSGTVSGNFDSLSYPFTMMSYFQVDETVGLTADILRITEDNDSNTHSANIRHHASDNLNVLMSLGSKLASLQVVDINPMGSDFATWWAVVTTLASDGIAVTHNVWSGVGASAILHTGAVGGNTLTGAIIPLARAYIGPGENINKFINVQESVVIDKVLTTGQLSLWVNGVPAPQANLPGNIIFYQPLATGYNEPTSVGIVGATGTDPLVVEYVAGPLMFGGSATTNTTGDITTLAQWADIQTDASGNVLSTDIGQLSNNLSLIQGSESGQVNNLYHTTITGTSGIADVYDLTDLSDSHINITLDRSFLKVKSISVQNLSTGVGQYLDFDVSSSSGFGPMFGEPNQPIVINPKSCLQRGDAYTGYLVDTGNRVLEITAQSTGVVYEMVILGN